MNTNSWTTAGQKKVREKSRECHNHKPKPFPDPKPKTYRQAPTHWLKFYEEAVIESESRTAVVQLKSEA